jgi:hypothetical protein
MANDNPEARQLLALILGGSTAIPIAAGGIDLFSGTANASNSGELPMNMLLSMLAPAGAAAGVGTMAMLSPRGEAAIASQLIPVAARREALAIRSALQGASTPADIQRLVQQRLELDQQEAEVEKAMRERISRNRDRAGELRDGTYSADRAGVQRFRRAGVNQLMTGALAGSALGGIYALNQMDDPG